jgi:Fungal N-terminal domain of STAND proteins
MAGISEAASIIAIIQISAKVFSWCQEYIANVKDAAKDVKRLSDGVNALAGVLGRIEGLDSAKLSNLSWLSEPGGQLDQCKGHLDELAAKMYQEDRAGMRCVGLRTLKWHFSSKEVEKYIRVIDRHKAMLSLALAADQTWVFGLNTSSSSIDSDSIRAITLDIDDYVSSLREDKIIAWLSSPDASKSHIAAREKHESSTGNWLLKRSDFEYWKLAPNSLLWLHGKG